MLARVCMFANGHSHPPTPTPRLRVLTERLLKLSDQHHKQQVSSSRGGTWFPTGTDVDLPANAFPTAPSASSGPTAAAAGGGALAVAAPPTLWSAGQQQQQHPGLAQHDDLSSLLEALAAVFRVRAGLWHEREAPAAFPYVTTFMSHVSGAGIHAIVPWCLLPTGSVTAAAAAGLLWSRPGPAWGLAGLVYVGVADDRCMSRCRAHCQFCQAVHRSSAPAQGAYRCPERRAHSILVMLHVCVEGRGERISTDQGNCESNTR